jgi:ATP-dependent Clp protease protease subunit
LTSPTQEQGLLAQVEAGANLKKRTLYISGEIDSNLAHGVIVALESLDVEDGEIRIVLNSEGGDELSGYAIYDAITMCKNKVVIDGYGNVLSIAAAIMQAGDIRRMAPNAALLIHNGSTGLSDEAKQDEVVSLAEQIKKDNKKYYDILCKGSGQPWETIEEWCGEETFFTAAEAVAAGFADKVIKPLKKYPRRKRKK